ncbi:MAG: D-aminoacyl-tRNA deacylase [Methanomassiliicoccaceae archaeon]|nr:D-aminoacyl-tRNA deacylase [Methanomassiliicoccaceae archaeon]
MRYKLLLCSAADTASVNIKDSLIRTKEWEPEGELLFSDDIVIMTIPEMHIYAENVETKVKEAGIDAKEIIFLSRHRSSSGIPTLTVHPIGNFNDAELGGRPRTLTKASPATMTAMLRMMMTSNISSFQASFEVTHHGPYVGIPATFIEIGSSEAQWNNTEAADIIADSILNCEEKNFPSVIGIGGGHYAPRFTEVAATYEINFGHMIPEYAYKDVNNEELARIIDDAAKNSCTKLAYIHKRSMKSDTARRVTDAVTSCNIEVIDPKCLTRCVERS